jgi:hypothetical protein
MTLIMIIIAAALVGGVACIAARKHGARQARETTDEAAIRDLYDHYVAGIEAITQTYLLQAPSDEEWLTGIKKRTDEMGKLKHRRLTAASALTPQEARIASLVGEGLSKRDLQYSLYVLLSRPPARRRSEDIMLRWSYRLLESSVMTPAIVIALCLMLAVVALFVVIVFAIIHAGGWLLLGLGSMVVTVPLLIRKMIEAGRNGSLKSRQHEH